MLDETKHIFSDGSADTAIVKSTTVARNVCLLLVYTLEEAYATCQLHCHWCCGTFYAKRPANVSSVGPCSAAVTDAIVAGCRPLEVAQSKCYRILAADCNTAKMALWCIFLFNIVYFFVQSNIQLQEELNRNRGDAVVGDAFSTAWYGVNKFSDLSPQEFSGKWHYYCLP